MAHPSAEWMQQQEQHAHELGARCEWHSHDSDEDETPHSLSIELARYVPNRNDEPRLYTCGRLISIAYLMDASFDLLEYAVEDIGRELDRAVVR